MITVLPVKDKELVKERFLRDNIPFSDNCYMSTATENGNEWGYSLYRMEKDTITVEKIEPQNDLSLFDGVLRAALHVGVENGLMKAYYTENCNEENLEKLKFIVNKDEKELNISKLFQSSCNCKK